MEVEAAEVKVLWWPCEDRFWASVCAEFRLNRPLI